MPRSAIRSSRLGSPSSRRTRGGNANLFVAGRGFVHSYPEVPYWDVELFLEPRDWAVLYIDAMSGEVLRRNFCDIPCDS